MLVTYYAVLIAWVVNAFFDSFGDRDPWAKEGTTGKIAADYFNEKIIGTETLGEDGRPTRMVRNPDTKKSGIFLGLEIRMASDLLSFAVILQQKVWANVGYTALVWFLIWACLAGGTKYTGRITYFTMGLPIVLLFIFLIKALTLEGAEDGVKEYIGRW